MKLRVLLINPWIYDFAAADLWARPLGLLRVAECLSLYDVEFAFIDCMESVKMKRYGKGRYRREMVEKPDRLKAVPRRFCRYGISVDEFNDALKKALPVDAVLITSIMSWWYPGVQKAIECIRDVSKNIPIILGGIYATLWHNHAAETSGADFIFRGQAGKDLSFAFHTFGFRLKSKREQKVSFYKLGLYETYPFAPVLTGIGCPFNCDYCGSGQLSSGFVRRDVDSVVHDISEFYRMGVRDFAFYDDALLVDPGTHIKVILKEIVDRRMDMRFHCPNGLHARFIDDELANLMKKTGFRTLRLSLETVNEERQKETGGKVCSEDLVRAVGALKKQGFTKKDIGVYLMYGLPRQEFEEVRAGVGLLKTLDVQIHLAEFSPLPGTQAWNDLVEGGVMTNDVDPLLTNNTVFTLLYLGYGSQKLEALKQEVKEFNCE